MGCWRATPTGAKLSWVFQWGVAGWPFAFSSTVVAVDRDHPDHEDPGITSETRTGADGHFDRWHGFYLARDSSHEVSKFDQGEKKSHEYIIDREGYNIYIYLFTNFFGCIYRFSIYRSIFLSIHLSTYLSIYLPIYGSIDHLYIYDCQCIYLYLSICLSRLDMGYL